MGLVMGPPKDPDAGSFSLPGLGNLSNALAGLAQEQAGGPPAHGVKEGIINKYKFDEKKYKKI